MYGAVYSVSKSGISVYSGVDDLRHMMSLLDLSEE